MKRTPEELQAAADQIVEMVRGTDPEDRWHLYTLVAERLSRNSQNYQACHFNALVKAETRGINLLTMIERFVK